MLEGKTFDQIMEMAHELAHTQIMQACQPGRSDAEAWDELRSIAYFYERITQEFLLFMAHSTAKPIEFLAHVEKHQREAIEFMKNAILSKGKPH